MADDVCATCGGNIIQIEVVPITRLVGPEYGRAEGAAVSGSVADVCSHCDRFAGELCDKCGGRVLWEWHGPGQALWVCEGCEESDIALQAPPRPHTWKCSGCGHASYSWTPPVQSLVCVSCRAG